LEELSSKVYLLLTNPRDLEEVEETWIEENKNGVLYVWAWTRLLAKLKEVRSCYIIVLVALLGLAGRNRVR
jgi:hypothetical protein